MISVTMQGPYSYQVIVEGETETQHLVKMSDAYYRKLCNGKVTQEWVLVQSFRFLLEREPNTQILAEFDLSIINRYFPEFETELAGRLNN